MTGSQFQLLTKIEPSFAPSVITVWRSLRTGLQLVYIKHETPMVNGFFAVASEIDNDSGAPHTLEHLIFLGSRKYTYKGLLDQLSNKLMSSTNAWTATDQTVYTLHSAGWEGFKSLLPVYLDHILHPTLTDAGCLTEVYHIDGEGKERGVVFSEMQAVENTSLSIMSLAAAKMRYPPWSGYAAETGGLMSKLRYLQNDQIRDFHKLRYRPDNLAVIITGMLDEGELLQIMSTFDNSLEIPNKVGYKRPFVDSKPVFRPDESKVEVVEFPDTDETISEILVNWIGPHSSDLVSSTALSVFGEYLTQESTGILSQKYVEIEDPFAASVSYELDAYWFAGFNLWISGVPTDKMRTAHSKILDEIRNFQSKAENIDLKFMRECVKTIRDQFVMKVEQEPYPLAEIAIQDFLYGAPDSSELVEATSSLHEFDELMKWDAEKWSRFIKKYFRDGKEVVVLGVPSESLYRRLEKDTSERQELYRKKYGEEGLKKLAEKLQEAEKQNNKPIPANILESFKSPDPAKINLNKISTGIAGLAFKEFPPSDTEVQKTIDKDGARKEDLGLYLIFEDYFSSFITIDIELSSATIEKANLPLVGFFEEIFAMPMMIDGVRWSFQEVARNVSKDTVSTNVSTPGRMYDTIQFRIKVRAEDYHLAVTWFERAWWKTVFDDRDRLKAFVQKYLSLLPDQKRSTTSVLQALICRDVLTDRALRRATHTILCEDYYRNVWAILNDDENPERFKKLVDQIEQVRRELFKLSNMRVIVQGGIAKLTNPVGAWESFISTGKQRQNDAELVPLPRTIDFRSENGKRLSNNAWINPMPQTESSYLSLMTQGVTKFDDRDVPALLIAFSYLETVEGPFWRAIRGAGLAYGVNISHTIELGQMAFEIYRGSEPVEAVKAAKKIVLELADGTIKFDNASLEGAISSRAQLLVSSTETNSDTAERFSIDVILRKAGPNEVRNLLKSIRNVTIADLQRVFQQYLRKLFDSSTSVVYCVCNPTMTETIQKHFTDAGYKVEITSVTTIDAPAENVSENDSESSDES